MEKLSVLFIENATCFEEVKSEEDFFQSALAFGIRRVCEKPFQFEKRKRLHNMKSLYSGQCLITLSVASMMQ